LVDWSTGSYFRIIGFAREQAENQVRQLGPIAGALFFWASSSFFCEWTDGFEPIGYNL
jgi:hypothetical protein